MSVGQGASPSKLPARRARVDRHQRSWREHRRFLGGGAGPAQQAVDEIRASGGEAAASTSDSVAAGLGAPAQRRSSS
ncbi:hypothetical protein ACU4GD_20600 [Cupriavidus basilensis]